MLITIVIIHMAIAYYLGYRSGSYISKSTIMARADGAIKAMEKYGPLTPENTRLLFKSVFGKL